MAQDLYHAVQAWREAEKEAQIALTALHQDLLHASCTSADHDARAKRVEVPPPPARLTMNPRRRVSSHFQQEASK
jgi:hypothetical protein